MDCVIIKLVESGAERRAAYALRSRVFVHEQRVPLEEEVDEYDESATHVVAVVAGRVVGTGRAVFFSQGTLDRPGRESGDFHPQVRIGRMAVEAAWRRRGVGGRILEALEAEGRRRGIREALLNSQTYVSQFYASHGYVQEGPVFLDAGIDHVLMRKRL